MVEDDLRWMLNDPVAVVGINDSKNLIISLADIPQDSDLIAIPKFCYLEWVGDRLTFNGKDVEVTSPIEYIGICDSLSDLNTSVAILSQSGDEED